MAVVLLAGRGLAAPAETAYGARAREVMVHLQKTFWDARAGLYVKSATDRSPDFLWPGGVAFSALVGAARHEPKTYGPLLAKYFAGSTATGTHGRSRPGTSRRRRGGEATTSTTTTTHGWS
jgi:hypothetical protein